MADSAINNPLFSIQTGSIVFDDGGFGAPVIEPGLTTFIGQQSGVMTMTGNSDYVYTDHMNQGSLGVSGSYGVSGISKLSGAVSAYVGQSVAGSHNTLSITLNCIKWAGAEYVDFDRLTVSDLMARLKKNVRSRAEGVLQRFLAMRALRADPGKSEQDKQQALVDWLAAVNEFHRFHGTGMVVATLWGGWGAVKIEFKTKDNATRWQAGGSGQFTYQGTGAAVDVQATYGHTESTIGADAKADVTAYYNGACVGKLVTSWFNDLSAKAQKGLSEIGKASATTMPSFSSPIATPKVPEFVPPKKEETVTDLIGKITTMDGLETYAKAAAYEQYKKNAGPDSMSLHDFINNYAPSSNSDSSSDDFLDFSGGGSNRAMIPPEGDLRRVEPRAAAGQKDDKGQEGGAEEEPSGPASLDQFEPMGVWIVNWSQLFPWMATGHSNEIPKDGIATDLIKLRVMHQDLLTLSKLYQRFAYSGVIVFKIGADEFSNISRSCASAAARVSEFVSELAKNAQSGASGSGTRVSEFIDDVRRHMSGDAQSVYDFWSGTFMRDSELGLGIRITAPNLDPRSFRQIEKDKKLDPPTLARISSFDPARGNLDAFSEFVKGVPLIVPNKTWMVYLMGSDIANSGVVVLNNKQKALERVKTHADGTKDQETIQYHLGGERLGDSAVRRFVGSWDADGKHWIEVYPIPFEAANGITWRGSSVATGLGTLKKKVADVRKALSTRPRWSFDSDYWHDWGQNDDKTDHAYSLQRLSLSYIGVTDEPPNLLPKARD